MNKDILQRLAEIDNGIVVPALVWEGEVRTRTVLVDEPGRVIVCYYAVSDIEHKGDEDCVRTACAALKGAVLNGVTIVDTSLEFGVRYGEDGEGTMGVRGTITFKIE
jgi:hypothetical protein